MALIFTLYAIVMLSLYGGKLPTIFIKRMKTNPYEARMRAMLIFAFIPLVVLFAQPLGTYSPWFPVILIGIGCAAHQSWSANIYTTVSDMFPKNAIATVTGIGGMAGGVSSMLMQACAGNLFVYADEVHLEFLGFVGKPAGLLSVDGTMGLPSVESELRTMSGGKAAWRVVHRLDQDTSGLLLVAKDVATLRRMQAMFAGREVTKEYEALLDGLPSRDAGSIDLPLAPDWNDRPRQMVDSEQGKPAQTGFRVLTRGSGWARVRFEPFTGRTHQIRLHAAHTGGLGAPIRGDRLYGHPADRLYLHAARLTFRHPVTGRMVDLHLPVPF